MSLKRRKKPKGWRSQMPDGWLATPTSRTDAERDAERFARQFHSEERVDWVRWQRCCTCSAPPPCENSHLTHSVGAGGTWEHIGPQCTPCHAEFHQAGKKTFEERYGCSVDDLAAETNRRWRAWKEAQEPC